MGSRKKKSELEALCKAKNIVLNPNVKYTKEMLVNKLGDKSLELGLVAPSWGLLERRKLRNPAICQWYKRLKENQKQTIMADDNNWVVERKFNGARICVFYHPDWGFQFFSRHNSEINFLPIEYSNLLINMGNTYLQGEEFKGKYNFPFIIDSEVITTNKELDLSVLPRNANKLFGSVVRPDFIIKSELNSASTILQYNKDDSFLLQKQNPMIFQVFDIMMINNQYLYNTPLYQRLKILDELMKYLPPCFKPCELVSVKKMDYFENIVTNENAEGIVAKNLNSIYNTAGTRHADKWVKLKRSMDMMCGKDIDAYVTGFTPGTSGTKNEGLVGSLEFSVYLMDKNGLTQPHVIANISGFSDEFRRLISTKDNEGNVALKDELYNKVFAINGHTVSAVNLRFNHAVLVSEYPRLDKNYYQCDLPEEVLRQSIL